MKLENDDQYKKLKNWIDKEKGKLSLLEDLYENLDGWKYSSLRYKQKCEYLTEKINDLNFVIEIKDDISRKLIKSEVFQHEQLKKEYDWIIKGYLAMTNGYYPISVRIKLWWDRTKERIKNIFRRTREI